MRQVQPVQKRLLTSALILFFLTYGTGDCVAQTLTSKNVYTKGGDVILTYDLEDDDPSHRFSLQLYSSKDNFIEPLLGVEGDVGIDQTVGRGKRIVWHAKEELGAYYKGAMSLEIKGKLYIPFIGLESFERIQSIKRSVPQTITWEAGRGSTTLTWNLFNRKDELVQSFTNIANVGDYDLTLPADVRAGKGYYFEITDQDNREEVVRTPTFEVKRKIPLFWKGFILGGVVTGGAILAAGGGEGTGGSSGGGDTGFPDPVLPSEND